ncbi:MAG: prepilin-type N-terminal cleavage/methylation domain-containing protein [Rubrivivax sp.]
MIAPRHRLRGISLIEALVALAVMAFGMLGIVGIQASLRNNADVARQRAEAVRIADEVIESARAYSVVNTTTGKQAYQDITAGATTTTVAGTNASFTKTVTITDSADFRFKTLNVKMSWLDRTNATQEVQLTSVIHRVPPELGLALAISGEGTGATNPSSRHWSIPTAAVPYGVGGTSSQFTPPGAGAVSWIFNNVNGQIKETCVGTTCSTHFGWLLQGYILFATSGPPGPADAETPASNAMPATVTLTQTAPASASPLPECYFENLPSAPAVAKAVNYYCLVSVLAASGPNSRWSGHSEVFGLSLASAIADTSAGVYRVCRYTPHHVQQAGNTTYTVTISPGPPPITQTRTILNEEHPYDYAGVGSNLVGQNFLVIQAGNGTLAYGCPDDDPSTPLVNGSTWHHQPKS